MKPDTSYRRRFLFYLLFVALVGIWAKVFFSLYEQVDGGELSFSEPYIFDDIKGKKEPLLSTAEVAYKADFADPFAPAPAIFYKAPVKLVKKIHSKETRASPEIPQLTLQGITGITATLHSGNDIVHFVKPGSSVEGVKILEVESDQVLAKFANTTFTLKLKH